MSLRRCTCGGPLLPTCGDCGNYWVNGDSAKAMDALGRKTAYIEDLKQALKDLVDRDGVAHDYSCPGDDTCECTSAPLVARINKVLADE